MDNELLTIGDVVSKTFCAIPWVHLNTWPNGNVYPCCVMDWKNSLGNLQDVTLEQLWNSEVMMEIRKTMLEGKKHSYCEKCYVQEEYGVHSARTAANSQFKKHLPVLTHNTDPSTGFNKDFKLLYWDFRFSNICNFKCRMCGPFLSSKWYEDEEKLYGGHMLDKALLNVNDVTPHGVMPYVDRFIDCVEEIYFAGGEPLIMDEHYIILEKLIETNNLDVRLRYNTNFSHLQFKEWDVIQLWKKFNNVSIFASIDAHGDLASYIRKGTDWKKIEKNIKKILQENIDFHISITIQILNIYHIPDLIDKLVQLGISYHNIHANNVLTDPQYFNINILPDEHKKRIKEKYEAHLGQIPDRYKKHIGSYYEGILKFLSETVDDVETKRTLFSQRTKRFDEIRNENLSSTCPELVDLLYD